MALTQVQSQMLGGSNPAIPTSVGVGTQALNSNSGANNTAVGYQAGYSNTTGTALTALGYQAAYGHTTGNRNTAIGRFALNGTVTGEDNVGVGNGALYSMTSGNFNTTIGSGAGNAITTGGKNTIIGAYSGNQASLDIRTASNRIVLSDGDGNPKMFYDGSTWNIAAAAGTNLNNVSVDNAQIYGYPDNTFKCGYPSYRWTVVYAVSGTINTSDANQKQQIRSLDEKEIAVAKRIKRLIKAFKWNDSVAEKGDGARIHVGVIAQEVQAAFEVEGLDASKYGMFCSDTWYEVNGDKGRPANPYTAETEGAVEVTQLGVRYDQLLAFVIAAL